MSKFKKKLGLTIGFLIGWIIISLMINVFIHLILLIFGIEFNFWLSLLFIGFVIFVFRIKELLKCFKEINLNIDSENISKEEILKYRQKLEEEVLGQEANESDLELIKEATIFKKKLGLTIGFLIGWIIISLMINVFIHLILLIFGIEFNFWLSWLFVGFVIFVFKIKELLKCFKVINLNIDSENISKEEILKYRQKLEEEMLGQGANESDLELIKEATIINAIKENKDVRDVAWALLQ